MTDHTITDKDYKLSDCYDRTSGRVFMTGTQALVRITLDQARRDRENGLQTAGFVSGYRGSPLGAVDKAFWSISPRLKADNITFHAAINEDLAVTAVLGAQQAHLDPDANVKGVFGMWYGKGPGVDRSGDALRHGNAYGTAPQGGVLVVAGDDHGCVSSSMPHQSDVAFMSWLIPTLNPASIADYQTFGEYGYALSRFTGAWVGFKAISETVEAGQSVALAPDRVFVQPEFTPPAGGLHIRLGDLPDTQIETRLSAKIEAVRAFVEANPIDHAIYNVSNARYGIVTTGKAHLDTLEALRLLGLTPQKCRDIGIDIYKVGMVWPLGRRDALAFASGKQELLVIEEKRGIIESQLKECFYDYPGLKPARMVGKRDDQDQPLVPWTGELSPLQLVPIIAARLAKHFKDTGLLEKAADLTRSAPPVLNVSGANRTPYFCSGCPHNTSTKVPCGSKAASGIGCHVMASWMDRDTTGFAQMGAEGVPWVAASKFNGGKHIFQNLGEGTWYHSGSLAIRQAVAASTNITYKILFNDAVAMTGGQPVDGPVSPHAIAWSSRSEGVERIAMVSDAPAQFIRANYPPRTTFSHRDDLDAVQRELRGIPGVTVLIYQQTCATEKRRKRKRGQMDDPAKHVVINSLVCEGCGDCSIESNCLSVEPRKTPFGLKRKINLSSCNKDFTCVKGFCPSFVTIEGGQRKKSVGRAIDLISLAKDLPMPTLPALDAPFDLLVTGVGGTGVVTVGAVITMAAHLEGHGASVLDFTGFAQKFGTVVSYVRVAKNPDDINQVRTEEGSADAVIGCDAVVSSSPKASIHYGSGTKMVLNLAEMPTGDIVLNRDADLRIDHRKQVIQNSLAADSLFAFDANAVAEELLGDSVFANVMLMGFAWQKGLVPAGLTALHKALQLNGVSPEANITAFAAGRVMAVAPEKLVSPKVDAVPETAQDVITIRADFLKGYQNVNYAQRYRDTLAAFQTAHPTCADNMLQAAAKSLFKLMAPKDEYEVARLHLGPSFAKEIQDSFEGNYKIKYHMAPSFLPSKPDARGRPTKRQFGAWARIGFKALCVLRPIRGGMLDPFRFQADRKLDAQTLHWFEGILAMSAEQHATLSKDEWLKTLSAPMGIRGYGPVRKVATTAIINDVDALFRN